MLRSAAGKVTWFGKASAVAALLIADETTERRAT
jgi:hypothetical protein